MDISLLAEFKDIGSAAALGLSAVGSGLGAGYAGMAAIGAWKKCYAQNKAASFLLLSFVGAPLTQTIYGLILMNSITAAVANGFYCWGIGVFGGLAMGVSAMMQGKAAASASEAFAETGKGFAQYLIVVGIIETVALFIMAFLIGQPALLAK